MADFEARLAETKPPSATRGGWPNRTALRHCLIPKRYDNQKTKACDGTELPKRDLGSSPVHPQRDQRSMFRRVRLIPAATIRREKDFEDTITGRLVNAKLGPASTDAELGRGECFLRVWYSPLPKIFPE